MTAEYAVERASERIAVTVELLVTHRVSVKIDAESDQTLDALKAKAMEEFHRDPNNRTARRTDDTWRFMFANRRNIEVGREEVQIAGVTSRPVSEGRQW